MATVERLETEIKFFKLKVEDKTSLSMQHVVVALQSAASGLRKNIMEKSVLKPMPNFEGTQPREWKFHLAKLIRDEPEL